MSSNIIVTYSDDDSDDENDDNQQEEYQSYRVSESEYCSKWSLIPEPVFLKIFKNLSTVDILQAGKSCRRWNSLSKEEYLWKKLFQRDFKVDPNIGLKPGT